MSDVSSPIIFLGIGLVLFFVCREIVCWYFKMNEVTTLLKEIRDKIK
mgnify:CR=1 FL=1